MQSSDRCTAVEGNEPIKHTVTCTSPQPWNQEKKCAYIYLCVCVAERVFGEREDKLTPEQIPTISSKEFPNMSFLESRSIMCFLNLSVSWDTRWKKPIKNWCSTPIIRQCLEEERRIISHWEQKNEHPGGDWAIKIVIFSPRLGSQEIKKEAERDRERTHSFCELGDGIREDVFRDLGEVPPAPLGGAEGAPAGSRGQDKAEVGAAGESQLSGGAESRGLWRRRKRRTSRGRETRPPRGGSSGLTMEVGGGGDDRSPAAPAHLSPLSGATAWSSASTPQQQYPYRGQCRGFSQEVL